MFILFSFVLILVTHVSLYFYSIYLHTPRIIEITIPVCNTLNIKMAQIHSGVLNKNVFFFLFFLVL